MRHRGPDWSELYSYRTYRKLYLTHMTLGGNVVCNKTSKNQTILTAKTHKNLPCRCSPLPRASEYRRNWYVLLFPASSMVWLTPCVDSGAQPLTNEDDTLILAVNGEIYNHRILRKQLKGKPNFKTASDCEVILHLVGLSNS